MAQKILRERQLVYTWLAFMITSTTQIYDNLILRDDEEGHQTGTFDKNLVRFRDGAHTKIILPKHSPSPWRKGWGADNREEEPSQKFNKIRPDTQVYHACPGDHAGRIRWWFLNPAVYEVMRNDGVNKCHHNRRQNKQGYLLAAVCQPTMSPTCSGRSTLPTPTEILRNPIPHRQVSN